MEVRVLGPVEVRESGEPLALGGPKQRELLAILALSANEIVSSDRLAEELWSGDPPQTAAKSLQVHVSQLRKILEPGRKPGQSGRVLVTRPPGYVLELDGDQLDLKHFQRLARAGHEALASGDPDVAAAKLSEGLGLWRGDPLADLTYAAFAQSEIPRLEEMRLAALEDRIEADLQRGRQAEVIEELERIVASEPLRERPRGQLMVALYRSGRQADALETYRTARRALVDELGIEPGKPLQDLQRAILAQDPSLEIPARAIAPGRASASPRLEAREDEASGTGTRSRTAASELVGRDAELRDLGTALDEALLGRGSVVLIGGEPGIGKSRLVDELAERARGLDAEVLWGRCWEAGGAPAYWPWVQSLRAYIVGTEPELIREQLGPHGGEVAHVLPELRAILPDLPVLQLPDSEGARFRVFDATSTFLRRAADTQALVLTLEDLHAADAPSLLLLEFIAQEVADARLLIVATYRDTELGPGHPLTSTMVELNRHQSTRTLLLRGVRERGVSRLIEIDAGVSPPAPVVAAIHQATEGNPLFVGELARLLATEGRLDRPIAQADIRLAIPHGLRQVIGRRLAHVSDDCRQTLGIASVLGREFTIADLARTSASEPADVVSLLDEAIRQRVVAEAPGGAHRMRFAHVLIRDVLYDELGAARRMDLHRQVGDALADRYRDDLDAHLAELAHHYLQAAPHGDADKAIAYSRRAGDRAARLLAYEEAARHYELALEALTAQRRDDESEHCELLLALGEAQVRGGELSLGKQTFADAAEAAVRLEDPELLGRAALGYGGRFVWFRAGNDARLVPLLEDALDAQPVGDSVLRARLLARLAGALRDQPAAERRLSMTQEAVEIARRTGDSAALAYTLEGTYSGLSWPEDTGAWLTMARELTRLAQEVDDKELTFAGHFHALGALMLRGDLQSVNTERRMLTELAEELRQPLQRWTVGTTNGMLALFGGRLEEAEEWIGQSLDLGASAQGSDVTFFYVKHLQTWALRREQGRLAEVEAELARFVDANPTFFIFRCLLASAHAELGREAEARDGLARLAAEDFADLQVGTEWFLGASLLAGVCAYLGDGLRAARLYQALSPYARFNVLAHPEVSLGSASRYLGLLASTMSRWEEAAAHFEHAIEMNERMGARPWLAHTQHDYAGMLARRGAVGDVKRAAELLRVTRDAYGALGMRSWETKANAELADS